MNVEIIVFIDLLQYEVVIYQFEILLQKSKQNIQLYDDDEIEQIHEVEVDEKLIAESQ